MSVWEKKLFSENVKKSLKSRRIKYLLTPYPIVFYENQKNNFRQIEVQK